MTMKVDLNKDVDVGEFFVTFPFKFISLRNKYARVSGTYEQAREEIVSALDDQWAFMYPIEELEYQVEMFHLEEVTLERASELIFR